MKTVRNIIAVLLGYAIFVISALLLFNLSNVNPHLDPTMSFLAMTIACGMISAFFGGLLTQLISGSGTLAVNYILAIVIAGFAAFSFFKTSGNHYSQIATILMFAPMSILAGVIYLRRIRR